MINNFAFEYLLERKWKEAIPPFERAARILKENGDQTEYANARANYWTCRFECDEVKEVEEVEAELKILSRKLRDSADWHRRKPLVLLAKIEERRGNLDAAVRLVEQAIEACKGGRTRYPELDQTYLNHLRQRCLG